MKRRAIGSVRAACSAFFLLARCAPPETPETKPASPSLMDQRHRLEMAGEHRDKVLLEMRLMLEAVDGIMQGLVHDDLSAVGTAARGAGMAMAADIDPEIMRQLPKEFLDLGVRTHKAFDELGDRMEAGGTKEDAIQGLARLTGNCVGCHASYRLDELR